MYFDQFYNALSLIIIFFSLPGFLVVSKVKKRMTYKQLLSIRPWVSTFVYLFISVLLCMSTFFKIKYVSTVIDIIIFSVATLVYSLIDIFYFQEIKKEHIWNLQKQFIRQGNKELLFRKKVLKGNYAQIKEHEKEDYSIVETENDGVCIFIGGEEKIALKPKKAMPLFLLKFYAKCFSLHMEEIPVFKDDDNLEQLLKDYQFFKPSVIYLFIKKHSKIIKRIILAILIFSLTLYLLYIVAASQNWFGIGDWIKQEA